MSKNRVAKTQAFRDIACRELPPPFDSYLLQMKQVVADMTQAAEKYGVKKRFTLDGRLLGDLGEVIAKVHFGLSLHSAQRVGEDGTCDLSGKTVEVKLRSNSDLIWVKKRPSYLLVIYLDPATLRWGIVCNGPGKELLAKAKKNERFKRFETTLSKLREADAQLPPTSPRINERT